MHPKVEELWRDCTFLSQLSSLSFSHPQISTDNDTRIYTTVASVRNLSPRGFSFWITGVYRPHTDLAPIVHSESPRVQAGGAAPSPQTCHLCGLHPPSDPPRLFEPGNDKRTPYIALSHCWGLDQTFRTVTANLESMRSGFKLEVMPKTYRDALLLARLLSIKYIWIDSLCIIQDDSLDWQIEASKMCDVYSNAHLTIGDKEGFLGQRPRPTKALNYPLKSQVGQPSAIEVRCEIVHNRGHPLFFRAWVIHERLLSTRMMYLEHEELVWECKHHRTCECFTLDSHRNTDWGGERPIASLARYIDNHKNDSDVYGWFKYKFSRSTVLSLSPLKGTAFQLSPALLLVLQKRRGIPTSRACGRRNWL